jgi:class I fructose-bisphosphate aldolase
MHVDFEHISKNGKALFLSYDQGMEKGPVVFNQTNVNPDYIIQLGARGGFQGVILQKGIAEHYYDPDDHYCKMVPLIVKLNGKTSFVNSEPFAPLVCTVEQAMRLGAVAVGYTVYLGSQKEYEGFVEFSHVVAEAHKYGIPVIGWMCPQGSGVGVETADVNAYAARVGLELGADIVNVHSVGSAQDKAWTVRVAGTTRVLFGGGEKVGEKELLQQVKDVKDAGAFGMAIGRNIWQSEQPLDMVDKIKGVLFG